MLKFVLLTLRFQPLLKILLKLFTIREFAFIKLNTRNFRKSSYCVEFFELKHRIYLLVGKNTAIGFHTLTDYILDMR